MRKILFAAVLFGCVSVAKAVPVTLTISATLPSGNSPTDFSTSFSLDSATQTTDVYTSGGTFLYGYSAASLTGFGFTIDGTSYTVADIDPREPAVGHKSDFYLDAAIGSGFVSAINLDLDASDGSDANFGSTYNGGISRNLVYKTSDESGFITTDVVTSRIALAPSTVPEPGSIALLSIGGVFGLSSVRRRRSSPQRLRNVRTASIDDHRPAVERS